MAMKKHLLCCFHSSSEERWLKSSLHLQVHTRHSGLLVQQLVRVGFHLSNIFLLLFCCWKIDLSSYISSYFSMMLQPITVQYLQGIYDFNYSDSIQILQLILSRYSFFPQRFWSCKILCRWKSKPICYCENVGGSVDE